MRRAKKKSFPWRRVLAVLCVAVLVLSGTMVARDMIRSRREKAAYQVLAQRVRETVSLAAGSPAPAGEAVAQEGAGRLEAYAQLHQENPDMAGWIAIPGTSIDYPVMYTPQDPEYYLRRAFDGSDAVSGSIFVGEGSQPQGEHVILYGHQMDDGSMFADLLQYAEEDFGREHPTLMYDTLEQEREYQLVAAFYSRVYTSEDQNVFRYYQYTDLSDAQVFQEYVEQVEVAALYETGVEPQYGDRLLTLSTCSYHTGEGRFVVVACATGGEETGRA